MLDSTMTPKIVILRSPNMFEVLDRGVSPFVSPQCDEGGYSEIDLN